MFDLDLHIDQWRRRLGATEAITDADLAELDTHLRAAIAEYGAKGLTEEEAFWLADRQMGRTPEIAAEFYRENPAALWGRRVYWMLIGYMGLGVLFLAAGSLAQGVAGAVFVGGLRGMLTGVVYAAVYLGLLGMAFWGIQRVASRGLPVRIERWRTGLAGTRVSTSVWAAVAVMMAMLAAQAVQMLSTMVVAWSAGVQEFGQFRLYLWWVQWVARVLVPLALLGLIFWTRRLRPQMT